MSRMFFVFLTGSTLVGLLFFFAPEIDLQTAGLFYTPGSGFVFNGKPGIELMQLGLAWITGMFVSICLALLAINNLSYLHRLRGMALRVPNRSILYLLLTLALGPGLLVNGILKQHWGRARPREVAAFGGDKQFTKVFLLSDQCKTNCSFVSGEASLGFFALAFMFVAARRRRRTISISSLVIGSLIGLVRMAAGAHFFSDVVFAGVFTYLISYLLYLLLIPPSAILLSLQTRTVKLYKSNQKAA